ncbi:SpoIIE family protein phosphatase [Dactylosporangium aurantiacum]|uniref:SpoIIE family protein phosphatase n=2 Tax=Dactylosporangium aurantiacum TaxID=35754 RepID=A0A9Q9IU32_9ACTN|nr:SpoIIE family protein phosphatase [Dactylosporangium aurantiacum]
MADSAEKLRRLQAVTDAALSQLGLEDLLRELLERTLDILQVDSAAVLLLDQDGTDLVATATAGLGLEPQHVVRTPVGAGFAGQVAVRGAPVAVERVGQSGDFDATLLPAGTTSVLAVPMLSSGRVIGVLHVSTAQRRSFAADDIELLQLVADRASLATQARRSHLDRAAAVALQRSLLPARPPAIPGLDVAVRYVPGAQVGVGGDWYDVFDLPSGHVGIVIGDVAGSGLHAAVVMGRIRSALRAYAMETDDPADVLTRLDRKVQRFEPDAMATAIYAVLDPTLSTVTLSNAGHLPPVLTAPDTPGTLLKLTPDLPLGAYRGAARRDTRFPLEPGQGLFLYTDGLVERRGRGILTGLQRMVDALPPGSADATCNAAMTLLDNTGPTDDVAVLAVRRDLPALNRPACGSAGA